MLNVVLVSIYIITRSSFKGLILRFFVNSFSVFMFSTLYSSILSIKFGAFIES